MDCTVDNETLLVIRCVGLTVSPKTTFKNVGVLSNIFLRATGTKHAVNEKRTVRLSQSESFRPNGRPPNSDFAQIYTSEVIEDSTDAIPSMVASIRCPPELDCMIRLSVYYSSNLTGEKEVLLAGTSFTRKELLRAVYSKGVLVSDMVSEHCPGSKAHIEIMEHMPNVLPDTATVLPSTLPEAVQLAAATATGFNITAPRTPVNPFKQRYVFYSEQDHCCQLVSAEESTWEPRHSALIPAMFMENFTSALVRSINAWNMRYELERKRQGRFRSLKEALAHGWHSVNVTVHAARIGGTRAQTERLKQQQMQLEAALAGENNPSLDHNSRTSRRYSTNNSSHGGRPMSVAVNSGSNSNNNGPPLPLYNVCVPIRTGDPQYVDPKVPVLDGVLRGNGKRVLHDESAPCTFVDISVQDMSQMFLLPLGRTNTEYYTLNPQYGSNLNAPVSKKAAVVPLAATDCVEICFAEREYEFYSYDTTDRDAVNRWHHHYQQTHQPQPQGQQGRTKSLTALGSSVLSHGQTDLSSATTSDGSHSGSLVDADQHASQLSTTLQSALLPIPAPLPPADCIHRIQGREAHFYRFVSSCTDAAILFEVCVEDPSSGGAKKRIGTCTLPLSPALRGDMWLPVKCTSADSDFEDIELHISVSVKSPEEPPNNNPGHPGDAGDHSAVPHVHNPVHHDYLSDKPSPAAMPEVFMYQRSIQGQPERDGRAENPLDGLRPRTGSEDHTAATAGNHIPSSPSARKLGDSSPHGSPTVPWSAQSDNKLNDLCDYRATLANAYEWMWYAGFNGLDPLVIEDAGTEASPQRTRSKSRTLSKALPTSNSHTQLARHEHRSLDRDGTHSDEGRHKSESAGGSIVVDRAASSAAIHAHDNMQEGATEGDTEGDAEDFQAHFETGRMSVFEYASAADLQALVEPDPPTNNNNLFEQDVSDGNHGSSAPVTRQPFSAKFNADGDGMQEDAQGEESSPFSPSPVRSRYVKRSRVDYCYPLEWIRTHVTAMEALAMELGSQVPTLKQVHRENRSFRASAFKKQPEWQALPVNLHYQLMAVRPHDRTPHIPGGLKNKPFTEVIHSVTCGAMTPHMLGHKNGGLYHQESKLVTAKGELDKSKAQFTERVGLAGYTKIPPTPTETYGVYKRLMEIGDKALKFESMCLTICHRRAYAISQSLSIAVNSLLLKLGLCMQGVVPERVCEQWMAGGILLVFEGLLSVVAHERSMLEDTISAVDALRSFQVRLLPYPDEAHLFDPYPDEAHLFDPSDATVDAAAAGCAGYSVNSSPRDLDVPPPPPHGRPPSRPVSSSNLPIIFTTEVEPTPMPTSGSAGSSSAPSPTLSDNQDGNNDRPPVAPPKPPRPLSFVPRPVSVGLDATLDPLNVDVNNINLNIDLTLPIFTSGNASGDASTHNSARNSTHNSSPAPEPATTPPPQAPRMLKLEMKGREVLIYVPAASLRKLPRVYQTAAYAKGGAVIPFYPVLFTQGIDIQQTMVTTFGGDSSQGRTHNLHLQHDVNLKGLRDVNAYCMKLLPVGRDESTHRIMTGKALSPVSRRKSLNATTHPMVKTLHDTILSSSLALKNVDLLIEVERLSVMLGGCRITFCKSGKDRTGMACTLEQSRQLGERYGCGMSVPRILKDANLMRVHGCRLLIAEKNIGRKVYSINKLQAQFLPVMFRPPNQVCEDIMKKDNS